jgi:hypothetical protein
MLERNETNERPEYGVVCTQRSGRVDVRSGGIVTRRWSWPDRLSMNDCRTRTLVAGSCASCVILSNLCRRFDADIEAGTAEAPASALSIARRERLLGRRMRRPYLAPESSK